MKIQIDIAHPAHIHYFRNFAKIFKEKGHQVLFTIRDKGIIIDLANHYKLTYIIRSKEEKSKLVYGLRSVWAIFKAAKSYKPDIFLDMGTIFASPVAKFFRKPYIAFDDTESAYKTRMLHMPFTNIIFTPEVFKINLGYKQIRFNGCMELMYLNKNYYRPDSSIFESLKIKKDEKYVLIRFVNWDAHHDKGLFGFSDKNKLKAVFEFSKYAKVFISSEQELTRELEPYRIQIKPEQMHDVLAHAFLFFGEAATMASESVILGTPAIYLNENWAGTTEDAGEFGLLHSFKSNQQDQSKAIEKGIELLNEQNIKQKMSVYRDKFLQNKIDVTAFLVWFVENYPESVKILNDNPDFQKRFI